MARSNHQTLEQWITEAITSIAEERGATCSGLVCLHINSTTGKQVEVDTIDLGKRTWDPTSLARRIKGRAESYSEALGGIVNFQLIAYYGGKEEGAAVHPFNVIEGELSSGSGSHVRESADAKGITGMIMRHLEKKEQLLVGFIQGIVTQTMQNNAQLQREVNDAYAIVREQLIQTATANHEHRMKELEYARATKQQEEIFKQIPAFLNAIKPGIIPQSSVDTTIVEGLARKISPEMVRNLAMMGVNLTPEEIFALEQRIQQVRAKDKAEAEAIAKVPPTSNELAIVAVNGQKEQFP